MFLIIEDNYKIYKHKLNNHFVYKGIQIDVKQNDYFLYLKDDYYINNYQKEIKLEYKKYEIINKHNISYFYLYVYKDDTGIDQYNIYENNNFIIANHLKANINSYNKFSNEYYIYYKDGYLKSNYEYLSYNSHSYNNERIKDGDYIDYFGVHIIFYEQFLYINNFNIDIHLNIKKIDEKNIKAKDNSIQVKNYYEQEIPELIFEEIKAPNLPKKVNTRNLLFQIGPSVTMSLGMLSVAFINMSTNGQINYTTILMPLIMLLSCILWPTLININDKRKFKKEYEDKKNRYLNYLNDYETNINNKIHNYLCSHKKYYFNSDYIFDKLFYISSASNNFLKISLGHYIKSININQFETSDIDINEKISRIKYRLNNIEDYPLYLDININSRITIITLNYTEYFIKKILLELCYKYHPDDLKIILYTKNINLIYSIYNLPHLFNKGIRQTYLNEQDLYELNRSDYQNRTIVISDEMLSFNIDNPLISIFYFSNNEKEIIKDSDVIISYLKDKGVYKDKNKTINFKYENEDIDFDACFKYISLYTKYDLTNKINSFIEMNPSLNIKENYLLRQESLEASFALYEDKILSFDLHESKDGPHGLVGGSTGSGKSELIVSLLLSLAIKYRPDYLNIILIDYKGGGIKESLSYNGKHIPHIIASVDNLNPDTFERLIIAISKECKRRQKLFKELSNLSNLSIVNIDDYINNHLNFSLPAISHLLIVVDEFAELKKENPEIIKELISFSRIGRSLGLHLILATQKPSGVIDEEIWSNSRFKIALKVQSEKDSLDIIKTKDSAYLSKPGEFYLKVDNKLIKATSIYSKRDINLNNSKEVSLLDNKLEIKRTKVVSNSSPILEANYLAKQIIDASNSLNIESTELVYNKAISLKANELAKKYNINNKLIFGEKDDYLIAKKDILAYSTDQDILIYSSRNNEIDNILIQFERLNINMVIISSKLYKGKNILASCLYDNEDDVTYLLNKLLSQTSDNLYLVIEDYVTLISYNDEYGNILNKIIKRNNLNNVHIILITRQSNISFKLLNSFKNKLIINSNDNQDQLNIFSNKSIYKGDSFYFEEKVITFVPCLIEKYLNSNKSIIDYLDTIPNIIKLEFDNQKILIGYDLKQRKKIYLNINENILITGFDENELNKFNDLFKEYKNIKICLYNNNLIKEKYDVILWTKNGINIQRLFYIDKYDEFDGYYLYRNNKGREIKPVNHG